jgi:hypothetical protein
VHRWMQKSLGTLLLAAQRKLVTKTRWHTMDSRVFYMRRPHSCQLMKNRLLVNLAVQRIISKSWATLNVWARTDSRRRGPEVPVGGNGHSTSRKRLARTEGTGLA